MGVMQGYCWVADSIVAIVSNVFKFFMSVVHGHERGKRLCTCLVLQPGASGVVSLQHLPMLEYASCARAWTRYEPRCVPSVSRV